jgi:hypothetical protein
MQFYFSFLHAQEKTMPIDPQNYLKQKKENTNAITDWSLKNKVTDEQFKNLLAPGFSITISGNTYKISDNTYNLSNDKKLLHYPKIICPAWFRV